MNPFLLAMGDYNRAIKCLKHPVCVYVIRIIFTCAYVPLLDLQGREEVGVPRSQRQTTIITTMTTTMYRPQPSSRATSESYSMVGV